MGAWILVLTNLLRAGIRKLRNSRPRKFEPLPPAEKISPALGFFPIQRPLVIIPTKDEAQNIRGLMTSIARTAEDLTILVVDDSRDELTAAVVRSQPAFGDRVHLLRRRGGKGLGSAYREAMGWALNRNFDAVVTMDADLSHNPADIPRLLESLHAGADVAIGSRYEHGVRVLNWPLRRLFLSALAGVYVRAITGLPLTDPTSGFKAIRTSALACLDWGKFRAEGYGFQVELHYFLWCKGCAIQEVPIVFTERSGGVSKMTRQIAWEAAVRTVSLSLLTRRVGRKGNPYQ